MVNALRFHFGCYRKPKVTELHDALHAIVFKLLSVTSQVRKARGYFNELQVKRSPFVDKSMI